MPLPQSQSRGFTLTELAVVILLVGLIATFTIPVLLGLPTQQEAGQLSRQMFTTIGESYLQMKLNRVQYPLTTLTNERKNLAEYINDHGNFIGGTYTTGTTAATLCSAEDDYFIFPKNVRITKICDDGVNALIVTMRVPIPSNAGSSYSFDEYVSTVQDRYTTKYGWTNVAGDCALLDRFVNVCGSSPACPAACPQQ